MAIKSHNLAAYFQVGTVLEQMETYIASPSGTYTLWNQADGNLVCYRVTNTGRVPGQGRPYWALQMYDAYPARYPGPYTLVLRVRNNERSRE